MPGEVVSRSPELPCEIGGSDWVLERVTCSALALGLEFRSLEEAEFSLHDLDIYLDPVICLKNGETIDSEGYTCGVVGSSDYIDMTLEFQMPIDVEEMESVIVCGQEIFLKNG